jgi:L-malate glycosyltransferase
VAKPRVGLAFDQFATYHVDRCEAVAARLGDRCEVVAVEVASASQTYAWKPSGEVRGAAKITLFPGAVSETIGTVRKFRALFGALWRCRWVFIGIPSSAPEIVLLSWALPLVGARVVMMTESKYDDFPRRIAYELLKAVLYLPYRGAIVGGRRQVEYLRFLGFRRRPVLPGYDTVNLDRVRDQSGHPPAPEGKPFAERSFLFVGRFVPKKNLLTLLDAYARYRALAGEAGRDIVLVGSGEMREEMDRKIAAHGIEAAVRLPGFLDAAEVAQTMSASLALILPSTEEQWGLVVNEAIACGLPVIASEAVGARDSLVREFENGYVCRSDSVEGMAQAMLEMGADEARWRAMCERSLELNWLGHSDRFADAVETMIRGRSSPAREDIARLTQTLGLKVE